MYDSTSGNPIRRYGLAGLWAVFLGAFVVIGFRGVARTADPRTFDVSAKFVSTDSYLLATLGVPHASEQLLEALKPVSSERPILFIGKDNANARMTYFLVASL